MSEIVSITETLVKNALASVKIPGAKMNLLEANQIIDIAVREKSVLVLVQVPSLTVLIEKSLRFQIEKALKALSNDVEVVVEFSNKAAEVSTLPASIFAIGSGKGGVGKSSVSVNLAVAFQKLGFGVGILDCDIYGPSVPTLLNIVNEKPLMMKGKIQPIAAFGMKVMSAGFFVEPGQSIVWRGPMIHKLIQQFINDVDWTGVDILIVDLPPGTGDAPLSLAQTIPLTGAVMVSTPQHLSLIDVHKGVSMFNQVKVPILGIIENMSHFVCPSCYHVEAIFDRGRVKSFCHELGLPYLGDIPIDSRIRELSDQGRPFLLEFEGSEAGRSFLSMAKRLLPFVKALEDVIAEKTGAAHA